MKKKRLILICGIIVLIIFLSFYFDYGIIKGISAVKSNFFDDFFGIVVFVSSEVTIFALLTFLFLFGSQKRKLMLPLWIALALSALISTLLKASIQRLRPFQTGIVPIMPLFEQANHFTWNFSLPSFHAMLAFCAVPFLSKEFPKLKYLWIVFASLVGFSRVYFGLHFLSDVIVGGIIGYLIGIVVINWEKESKFGEKAYLKIFKRK